MAATVTLLCALLTGCGSDHKTESFVETDTYLGQSPPGSTPEIFAPGIVNTDASVDIEGMLGMDMRTFYFVRSSEQDQPSNLTAASYEDENWEVSLVQNGASEPSISPDGRKIFLKTAYIEQTDAGWSEPKSLGPPFENIDIMRLSASSKGTFYFDTYTEELDTPIRYSNLVDGEYQQPKSLGPQFAIGKYNAHPFIAPDESYVIWDSIREQGFGKSDLYISFKTADGSWGPAVNMGDEINTSSAENYPSVSPDGKVIFFDRRTKTANNRNVNIFWVSASIIDELRPKE